MRKVWRFFIVVFYKKIWKKFNSSPGFGLNRSIKNGHIGYLNSREMLLDLPIRLRGCEGESPLSLQICSYACMDGCLFSTMVEHGNLQAVIL